MENNSRPQDSNIIDKITLIVSLFFVIIVTGVYGLIGIMAFLTPNGVFGSSDAGLIERLISLPAFIFVALGLWLFKELIQKRSFSKVPYLTVLFFIPIFIYFVWGIF